MVVEIRSGTDTSNLIHAAESRLREAGKEAAELDDRRRAVEQELERLRTEIGHLEGILALHGVSGHPKADLPQRIRSGSGIEVADVVVEIIKDAGIALHFREIEQRLRGRGIHAGGKDPANVLLAKYFSDVRLFRPARGTYALREWDKSASSVGKRRTRRKSR